MLSYHIYYYSIRTQRGRPHLTMPPPPKISPPHQSPRAPVPGNLAVPLSPPQNLASLPTSPWRQTLASIAGISPWRRLPERSSTRRWRNTQVAGRRARGMGGRAHETPYPRRGGKGGVLTPVVGRRRRDLDLTSFVGSSSSLPPRVPPQRPCIASTSPPHARPQGRRRLGSASATPERPSPCRVVSSYAGEAG
jgi:hypothetical protein